MHIFLRRLCNKKCPNLYGVKIHILECHEDFVGEQQDVKAENESVKQELPFKSKKKVFKRKFKRITHSKKPWCNYCWIKFKNVKEHREHREICPNKPSPNTSINQLDTERDAMLINETESAILSRCKSPIKIETKVDEGKEITDLHRGTVGPSANANSAPRMSKLNMSKARNENDWFEDSDTVERIHGEEEERMETLNGDGGLVDELMEEEDTSMEVDDEWWGEAPTARESSPAYSEEDWRERDEERRRNCPVPIRTVTVIMPDRAERVIDIDRDGTHTLSELELLGMTVEQFASEPSNPAADSVELSNQSATIPVVPNTGQIEDIESPILSRLLDKPAREVSAHSCSLCTSPAPDLLTHIVNYHKLTVESYLKVFPGDAAKFEPKKAVDRKPTANITTLVKKESAQGQPTASITSKPLEVACQGKQGHNWTGRPWYESVKTQCRICNKSFWHGQFVKHVKYEHSTPLKQYKELFPGEADFSGQYQCLVCFANIAHYSSPISGHLTSKHGMTITEYYEIYERFRERNEKGEQMRRKAIEKAGEASSTIEGPSVPIKVEPDVKGMVGAVLGQPDHPDTVEPSGVPKEQLETEKKFRCKMCNQLVLLNKDSITEHMQQVHGSSPQNPVAVQPARQEVSKKSDSPWYNRCTWTCILCSKTFCSGFWKHVNEKHFLKKEDYLRDYGRQGINIIHYHCRICNKKIPWSGASINAHTKSTHSLSLQEYESSYGPENPPEETEDLNIETGGSILAAHLQQGQGQVQQKEKWYNGCEYTCQICFHDFHSVAALSSHLREAHGTEKLSYFRKFGRDGIKVRKYNCKICGNDFPWSGVSISKHLTQSHQMSLQEYSRRFEPGRTFQHMGSQSGGAEDATIGHVRSTGPVSPPSVVPRSLGPVSPPSVSSRSLGPVSPPSRIQKHSNTDKLGRGDGFENIRQGSSGLKKSDRWYNKCSWNCQLCGRHFKTNASSMFKHVTQDHKVSVEDYKERYGNTGTVFVDHKCKLCFKKIPCNGLAMCKHFKHSHHLTLEEYERLYMVGDDGSTDSPSYVPSQDHWYNKCIWKCQICGKENKSQGSSKKHVAQMHKITYEEYFELFGNQGIMEVPWECIICQMVVSCNGVSIASHLNGLHKITLQEYEAAYLKGNVETPDSGQMLTEITQQGPSGQDNIAIDEDSIVSIDDIGSTENGNPLDPAEPPSTGLDSLADIAIENVVSIDDPDFHINREPEAEDEGSANDKGEAAVVDCDEVQSGNLLSGFEPQGAVVIHDVNLLEEEVDNKSNVLKAS